MELYDDGKFKDERRKTTIRRNINRLKKIEVGKRCQEMFEDKERYCFFNDGGNIIFAFVQKLKLLQDRSIYYIGMDGTYNSSPKEFCQLYTIHVILRNGQCFPLFHVLMKKRTETDYLNIFKVIEDYCLNDLGYSLFNKERNVIMDFEKAALNAIGCMGCIIYGCFFHYGQCIWMSIQRSGLMPYYTPGSEVWVLTKRLISLAFFKVKNVMKEYSLICDNALNNGHMLPIIDKINDLLNYYKKTWLELYRVYFKMSEGGIKVKQKI